MRKLVFMFFVAIMASHSVQAQLDSAGLTGKWTVEKVRFQDDFPEAYKALEKAMLGSSFTFGSDHSFAFDISIPDLQMKSGYWKLSSSQKAVSITEWKDRGRGKDLLMEIVVAVKDGVTIFAISETPFILEVKKQ